MTGPKGFIREIHRRSLWQVLGIYIAASWVALQVVETLDSSFGLPEWVAPTALVLLVVGLPVVLATAFVQEGTPGRSGSDADSEGVGGGAGGVSPETGSGAPAAAAPPSFSGTGAGGGDAVVGRGPTVAHPAGVHHRLLTWRNAILGGLAAFVLLGLGAGTYLAMRSLGIGPAGTLVAKGVLEERAPVLVADFRAPDSLLARAATEALRVDLSQSSVLRLVDAGEVRDALGRMGLPPDTRLDPETARELAQREGIPAVIEGEITPAGRGLVLTGRVVDAGEGAILVSHRETAEDSAGILPALDALSRKLRERIGESLRTLKADPPLARVTTADLEALRKYSQAMYALEIEGDAQRGISLLEEAIARDSAFAMAWRKLGVIRRNWSEPDRAAEAMTRAFEHRDRLTEHERYLAEGSYYQMVTDEPEPAITAYRNALELAPADGISLTNLAVIYSDLREYDRAAELQERVLSLYPEVVNPWLNLADSRANMGDYEGAEALLTEGQAKTGPNPTLRWAAALTSAARGRWEEAEDRFVSILELVPGSAAWTAGAAAGRAAVAATRGRLSEAERLYGEAARKDWERGARNQAFSSALTPAWLDALVRDAPARALRRMDDALARYPLEEAPPLDRPYAQLAELAALGGDPDRARGFLEALRNEVPAELRRAGEPDIRRAEGAILLAEGRTAEAIERIRASDEGQCVLCPLRLLGEAFESAGMPDSAVVAYETYLERADQDRLWTDQGSLGPVHERLAALHDSLGRPEKARLHYAKLTELWADADPELRPRVEAARARLGELLEAGG